MITIPDILKPAHIDLALPGGTPTEAILHVASLLRGDPRVPAWQKFFAQLTSRTPCVAGGIEFEICIPHARTDAVNAMVMAVGRSAEGVRVADPPPAHLTHYVFVIGVPQALTADYLRIVGALARTFRDPAAERALRAAAAPADFLALLASHEIDRA